MKPRNVLVGTACGKSKEDVRMEAWRLYKSPRIKAVYNRKLDSDMAILSAKHGLVDAHTELAPYDQLMDKAQAKILLSQVLKYITHGGYGAIVYFKAGAPKVYLCLITLAAGQVGVPLVTFGHHQMGDIGCLENIISMAKVGDWKAIQALCASAIVCP